MATTQTKTPPEAWQCDECCSDYDNEDDARECCPTKVIEGYICPVCKKFHDDAAEAIDCCDWNPDGPPPPLSALELEAAGQLRLIP